MQNLYKFDLENPNLESLGYVIAVANLDDKHDRSAPTDYHWKILKCRMIIFSSKSILACPEKKDTKQVHVVFNKLGDDYDKLNSLFVKFSLIQNGPIRTTTPDIYGTCFEYTMTAKIAPNWNTVGLSYLINNRDFLTTKGPQDGVSYQLITNEKETTIEIKPVKIHFLWMEEDYKPGEWVRVLPSLNKAVVEEHSDMIPLGSFKSYKDLRRHWKNIVSMGHIAVRVFERTFRTCVDSFVDVKDIQEIEYLLNRQPLWSNDFSGLVVGNPTSMPRAPGSNPGGSRSLCYEHRLLSSHGCLYIHHGYRLPENEPPYYSIRFWRGEPLTYPKMCITRSFPIITPITREAGKHVVENFLSCLKSRMSHVAGRPLNIKGIAEITTQTPTGMPTQAVSLCTPTQY